MAEKINSQGRPCIGLGQKISEVRWICFRVAVQASWLLFLCLVTVVQYASAQTGSPMPTLESIISCMALARDENKIRSRPYIVTRDYKLSGAERYDPKAQVVADVSFVPPNFKKYAIQQASGLGLGEFIVRRMLASEAEITKNNRSTDISPDNYTFRFLREEETRGQHCYVIELVPRRKDPHLLRGNIWVDAKTYLIHRTEGEPAKTLSWWLRDVRIVLLFGEVGGMWLQTNLEATASVRILGQYTMVSRDLKYEMGEFATAERPKQALIPSAGRISLIASIRGHRND